MELNGLDGKIKETEEKLKKWQELVKSNSELTKGLEGRITELEIKYIEKKPGKKRASKDPTSIRVQSQKRRCV